MLSNVRRVCLRSLATKNPVFVRWVSGEPTQSGSVEQDKEDVQKFGVGAGGGGENKLLDKRTPPSSGPRDQSENNERNSPNKKDVHEPPQDRNAKHKP